MLRTISKKEYGEDELRLKIRVNEMSGGGKEIIAKREKSVISGRVWKKVVGTDKRKVRVQRVGETGVKI